MNKRETRFISPLLAEVVTFAWFLFVLSFFYVKWRPLVLLKDRMPALVSELSRPFLEILAQWQPLAFALLIAFAALGAGRLLLMPLSSGLDRLQKFTFSIAAGLGALGLATLAVGLIGLLDSAGYWILLGLVSVSAIYGAVSAVSLSRGAKVKLPGSGQVAFLLLFVLIGSMLFAKALRPAIFYDAITYHLGVPNYWLQEGRIGYIPYDSFSNFPFGMEMLYTLGMFVSGLKAAQALSVLVFLLSVLAVYDLCRKLITDFPPALAASVYLLTPAFIESAVLYSNDLFLLYNFILAVYAFLLWKDGDGRMAALAGIFAGLCLSAKYTALAYVMVPAAIMFAWSAYRSGGAKAVAKPVAVFVLTALAVFSPWAIKNLIYTGNPLYPGFYGLFGGMDMSAEMNKAVLAMSNPQTAQQGLAGVFANLWNLFIARPGELITKYGAAPFIGIIPLIFLPPLVFMKGIPLSLKKAGFFGLAVYIIWCFTFGMARYLYPAVFVMALLVSCSFWQMWSGWGRFMKYSAGSLLVVLMLFNLCLASYRVNSWAGKVTEGNPEIIDGQFLARQMEENSQTMLLSFPAYDYINHMTEMSAKVLIVGDAQHLYIDRRHLYAYMSATTPFSVFKGTDEEISRKLIAGGVTHIVYNPLELVRLAGSGVVKFSDEDIYRLEGFLRSSMVKRLYRAEPAGRPVYVFGVIKGPKQADIPEPAKAVEK